MTPEAAEDFVVRLEFLSSGQGLGGCGLPIEIATFQASETASNPHVTTLAYIFAWHMDLHVIQERAWAGNDEALRLLVRQRASFADVLVRFSHAIDQAKPHTRDRRLAWIRRRIAIERAELEGIR